MNQASSNFRQLRQQNAELVDKSLFIADIVRGRHCMVITRPDGFGKSTHLSMACEFFRNDRQDQLALFQGLQILDDDKARAHMGRHPVIFFSLKNLQPTNLDELARGLHREMLALYRQFDAVFAQANEFTRRIYTDLIDDEKKDFFHTRQSLADLARVLHRHFQTQVLILLDDYDAPMVAAARHGFTKKAGEFLSSWIIGAFKDNTDSFCSLLCGLHFVSFESFFSGPNMRQNSILQQWIGGHYRDRFGFTSDETAGLLQRLGQEGRLAACQSECGGYAVGDARELFRPAGVLSIAAGISPDDDPSPFDLSRDLPLWQGFLDGHFRSFPELTSLLCGHSATQILDRNASLEQLFNSDELFSLAVMRGFFVPEFLRCPDGRSYYRLVTPNAESRRALVALHRAALRQLPLPDSAWPFDFLFRAQLPEFEDAVRQLFAATGPEGERLALSLLSLGLCCELRKRYQIDCRHDRDRLELLLTPPPGENRPVIRLRLAYHDEKKLFRKAIDWEQDLGDAKPEVAPDALTITVIAGDGQLKIQGCAPRKTKE